MPERFPSNIACAMDFSDLSAGALRYAARIAADCHAALTIVHAHSFEVPPYFTQGAAEELTRQYKQAAGAADAAVRQFAANAGVRNAEYRIEDGDAAVTILHAARAIGADLVVMGTHGRRGFERLMLGSVAERVLRTSSLPVLTVRSQAAPGKLQSILCPVNNSPASRLAFQRAAQFAVCSGAHLRVVHIEEDGRTESRIEDLCAWMAEGGRPECQVQDLRGRGNPEEEILKMAASSGADLLVIGASHKVFFDSTVLGSTTVRVVRHAGCPVLTVPEGVSEAK